MLHNDHIECTAEISSTHSCGKRSIDLACLEEFGLLGKCIRDATALVDILLRAALHTDVAELQRNNLSHDDVKAVCALVHEVDLGEDTDGALTVRINNLSQF